MEPRKKIGLALSGGAVLGAAHVGVLKALAEHNIKIDFISGTSIGALVGSLFAFGKNCDEVHDITSNLAWKDISSISFSSYGLFTNNKMKDFLKKHIDDVTFDKSDIPFAVIATDITNGDKVVLNEGNVANAVLASTCIPGVFKPINHQERLLVDGGIVENLPISPLIEMGADIIIAVDLNGKHGKKVPENVVDVLVNSFHFTLASASQIQYGEIDVLITPDLTSFSYISTKQTNELIQAGYDEAIKVLKEHPSLSEKNDS